MNKKQAIFNSAIALYFVVCFEILIMISPFAGFFYSVTWPQRLSSLRQQWLA